MEQWVFKQEVGIISVEDIERGEEEEEEEWRRENGRDRSGSRGGKGM